MSRLSFACLLVCSSLAIVHAQTILPPVDSPGGDPSHAVTPHLELATSTAGSGSHLKLVVDITPRAAFHIYAPGVKEYRPATLKVVAAAGVTPGRAIFPKPQLRFFEEANENVPVYAGPFRVEEDVTLDAARQADVKAGRAVTIVGTFEYQACDDRVCYKPATVPVEWKIAAH